MKVTITPEVRQIVPLAQFTRTNPLTLFNSSQRSFSDTHCCINWISPQTGKLFQELRPGFNQGLRALINGSVIYFVAIVKFLPIIQLTSFRPSGRARGRTHLYWPSPQSDPRKVHVRRSAGHSVRLAYHCVPDSGVTFHTPGLQVFPEAGSLIAERIKST
jgi:hypothetical protein